MTTDEMIDLFTADNDEYLKFDRVQAKRATRPDLHAFMLLNELVPGDSDIVSWAGYDEIWLGISTEKLAAIVTPEQVIELHRCGVRYDSSVDCLAMFV